MARLRGRRDDLGKVAIWKHVPSSARPRLAFADRRVEVLGGRDLKSLHPRRQRLLVLCLDDQMDVRALDADVHDTEIGPRQHDKHRLANNLVRIHPA